jgi:hypothetical protein
MTKKSTVYRNLIFASGALLVAVVAPLSAQNPRADLTRYIVIGDSVSAGFQSLNFVSVWQQESYPNLIAKQANVTMTLPLVSPPGFPGIPLTLPPAGRANPTEQATNLAVPGHLIQDTLDARPGVPMRPRQYYDVQGIEYMTFLVLGLPGVNQAGQPVSRSQVEWAVALNPTTISLWAGSNDALAAVLLGDPSQLTPLNQFAASFIQLLTRLTPTRATILVGNIPDVTQLPFVMLPRVAYALVAQIDPSQVPQQHLTAMGIGDVSTRVTALALPEIGARLQSQAFTPLPGNVVLTGSELSAIRERVRLYNAVINGGVFVANLVNQHRLAVVDINDLLADVPDAQLPGLFSADLVHPNRAGHIVLANEFIRVLNTKFRTRIPFATP